MGQSRTTPTSTLLENICCVILAIFIPPLGVLFKTGDMFKTCICLILTLMFGIPGMIYALIVIFGFCVMEEVVDEEASVAGNPTQPLINVDRTLPEEQQHKKPLSKVNRAEPSDKMVKHPKVKTHQANDPTPESTYIVVGAE